MKILESARKIPFEEQYESLIFTKEIENLLSDKTTAVLVKKHNLAKLKDVFLTLSASFSTLELSLNRAFKKNVHESNLLKKFFLDLLKEGGPFPEKSGGIDILLFWCSRSLEKTDLYKLLQSGMLDAFKLDKLQLLRHFYPENIRVLSDFMYKYGNKNTTEDKNLVLSMLSILYPTSFSLDSAEEFHLFIQEILPIFNDKYSNRLTDRLLINQDDIKDRYIKRIAEWFLVWRRHYLKIEKDLEKDDLYYEMDFATIIQYVPEFIWWNNGFYYRNGDKDFYYGSPGFFHLAKGGSIRKAPVKPPFTRRMADVFTHLPYDFDQTDKDMYIYCYVKSLGAGDFLSDLLQDYMRHSTDPIEFKAELDKWNPIIQKMARYEGFENLDIQEVTEIMGYIYHGVRDVRNFSIRRKTLNQLRQDSEAYYERIEQRREDRNRRAIINDENEWLPQETIKSYVDKDYYIIELTTKDALQLEGSVMGHCVGSYSNSCKEGYSSIWSLREMKRRHSLVTIEVHNHDRSIIQLSARFNASPTTYHLEVIQKWAEENDLSM